MGNLSRYDHTELRKVREFLGWSVLDLQEKLKGIGVEISENTLLNWEAGRTHPDADVLPVLAGVFGVGIERFYPEK